MNVSAGTRNLHDPGQVAFFVAASVIISGVNVEIMLAFLLAGRKAVPVVSWDIAWGYSFLALMVWLHYLVCSKHI